MAKSMRWSLTAVVLGCVAVAALSGIRAEEPKETRGRLERDLQYLASDELQGRGIGTDGLDAAARYVKEQFEAAGLNVATVSGDAFQKFSMVTGSELGSPNELKLVGPDGASIALEIGENCQICSFGGSGTLDAELVFCGYGIEDKDSNYDDFKDVDLKGKVAIVMRRVPQQDNTFAPFSAPHGGMSRHAELRTKVSNAFGKGAVGILFVNDPFSVDRDAKRVTEQARQKVVSASRAFLEAEGEKADSLREKLAKALEELKEAEANEKNGGRDRLMPFGYGGNSSDRSIPIAHISQEVCNELLAKSVKKKLEELEGLIDSRLEPQSMLLDGWKLQGQVNVTQTRAEIANVIGVIEGEGPLADETVVIGAHYDHVGMGGENSLARGVNAVHNGADDNGSGTVTLLELARRFGARKEKPARRLVFIAFTAEEVGLVGSARYVKEPLFPLDKTIAMFNMDMVGRLTDNRLTVFGSGTAPRWEPMLKEKGEQYSLGLSLKPEGFGPSDHSSFYGKKIPVLHFFTGTHSDYHRPSDDVDKINFDGMERILGMIEDLVVATVNEPKRPEYIAISRPAEVMRSGNRPYFGSIPDFGVEEPGYAISGVTEDSPAAKGGLKGGDRIVKFGPDKIGSLDDFDLALRKYKPGDEVEIVVVREGKEVPLKVTLSKPR